MDVSRRVAVQAGLWGAGAFAGLAGRASHAAAQALGPDIRLAEWYETVELEHEDRKRRLKRIAGELGLYDRPEFFEYSILRGKLPRRFPVDMPMLRVVFPERSFFDTARQDILPQGYDIVRLMAQNLRGEPPDVALFVAGHADARGTEPYNYGLSVARAEAVARALVADGIGQVVVWRVGFGEAVPIASNDTEAGQASNRRVEFLFCGRTEPIALWLSEQLDMVCVGRTPTETDQCLRNIEIRPDGYGAVAVGGNPGRLEQPLNDGRVVAGPGNGTLVIRRPVDVRRAIQAPKRF